MESWRDTIAKGILPFNIYNELEGSNTADWVFIVAIGEALTS